MPFPLILAHRGDKAHAPENTLLAFEQAWKKGADGIELDVWRCVSGEIVVFHDRNPEALTGKSGDVTAMSLQELRSLPLPRGERIPTLEEVLAAAPPQTWINIEIKGENIISHGIERKVVSLLQSRGQKVRGIISSFNPLTLFRLHRLKTKIPLGLIFHEESAWPLRRAWAARFLPLFSLHPQVSLLDPILLHRAKRRFQKVIAWTINNIHDLESCLQGGLHGMITDDPQWLREEIERRSIHAPVVGRR